jgi:hypothetical protein
MSNFKSMSHTSPLGYPQLLETRSILEVYGEGESSSSDEFRTVSLGDISCPVELAVEPIVVELVELATEPVVVAIQSVDSIVESVLVVELAVVPTQDVESET